MNDLKVYQFVLTENNEKIYIYIYKKLRIKIIVLLYVILA